MQRIRDKALTKKRNRRTISFSDIVLSQYCSKKMNPDFKVKASYEELQK